MQPSLAERKQIVGYVGRYTKRACVSESRISSITAGMISFSYKDYKNSLPGQKPKQAWLRLPYAAFLDRLLQHVPEKGYRMVRYYGCYANRAGKQGPADIASTTSPSEWQGVDFSGFESHWQQLYGEQALACKTYQQPFHYRGQYFPSKPSTKAITSYGYKQAITPWNSS